MGNFFSEPIGVTIVAAFAVLLLLILLGMLIEKDVAPKDSVFLKIAGFLCGILLGFVSVYVVII